MKPLVLDCETTSYNKGAPFAQRNKLCVVGCYDGTEFTCFSIEYESNTPYGESLWKLRDFCSQYDLIIGFNLKFDLHWLRRYGITFLDIPVWDGQLFQFIRSHQTDQFPSLSRTCLGYGLGDKFDTLDRYYEAGLDTTDIPYDELVEYNKQDCILTWQLYQTQLEEIKDKSWEKLFYNSCSDLLILEEMEWHGLKLDVKTAERMAVNLSERLCVIDAGLSRAYPGRVDNWSSNDWLSCVLYGGKITVAERKPYTFVYKDGRTVEKTHIVEKELVYDALVEPLKGSELKKQGFFSTDQGTLRKLKATKGAKEIINLVLERAAVEKQLGTYFKGIPNLLEKQDWADEILHGQLNQCVAATGRLSSSKPNQQNLDPEFMKCIVSRFTL